MKSLSKFIFIGIIVSVFIIPIVIIIYPTTAIEETYYITHDVNITNTENSTEYYEIIIYLLAKKEMTKVDISYNSSKYLNITSFDKGEFDGDFGDNIEKDKTITLVAHGNAKNDTIWSLDLSLKFLDESDKLNEINPAYVVFYAGPQAPAPSIFFIVLAICIVTIIKILYRKKHFKK